MLVTFSVTLEKKLKRRTTPWGGFSFESTHSNGRGD